MIAYFDCFSGISGDMIVGALLDAGVPFDWLEKELKKLPLTGYTVQAEDVKRRGIGGKRFRVTVGECDHERNLGEIKEIIGGSGLPENVKKHGFMIFERLAEAESRVHRVGIDEIHFHEVGAIDSIVDIVAAALSLSYLGIKEVYASDIPMSHGTVSCAHGLLPLPAPAVVELLKGVPTYDSPVNGELVTPTGAAFLAATCKGYGTIPQMKVNAAGYGAGERDNKELPNLLRVMVGAGSIEHSSLETDTVTVIEANIDDMNPEFYGHVMDLLLDKNALDVSLTPVYMKKGRPGTTINVICEAGKEQTLIDILFRETSTIGVRFHKAERLKLSRESAEVRTRFGNIRMKVTTAPWGKKAQPEYDDCVKAALTAGVSVREAYLEATNEFERGRYE